MTGTPTTTKLNNVKQNTIQWDADAHRVISVDSAGNVLKSLRQRQNIAGSAGTGLDGETNRVYTLSTTNAIEIVEVFLEGVLLTETTSYTVDNTAKTVTMLGSVFDSQTVGVFYNV